jgi:hypothetical protein
MVKLMKEFNCNNPINIYVKENNKVKLERLIEKEKVQQGMNRKDLNEWIRKNISN